MRLFVYEHICASGETSSLRTEGWAMLAALVEDFQRLPDCQAWTLLDHHCPGPLGDRCWRARREEWAERFRILAAEADATLLITPESGGVLAGLARIVIDVKGRLLGCTPDAIDLTADKKALAEHWTRHNVPTPTILNNAEFPGMPVVYKPRDGAGAQATYLIRNRDEWASCRRQAREELPGGEFVIQPWIAGRPASVSFMIGPGATVPLLPATQVQSDDGRFRYLGGELPLPPPLAQRAVSLGQQAIAGIQGLSGYVGIDLILGQDRQDDVAIEINPRLTTSYLGLRRLARQNLAAILWELHLGGKATELSWRPDPITFFI